MRVLVVDATPTPWWQLWRPEPWFRLAADVAEAGHSFDVVVRARAPIDVYAALVRYKPMHVEVWGHGAPGRPLIGNKALDPLHPSWSAVRGVAWFRSCQVAQGERGHAFFAVLTQACDVVAHVSKVGALGHSYLVGVRRGDRVWWRASLKPGSPAPWAPRTVIVFDGLPSWAFDEEAL